ncbi:hypothetical protein B0T22DRAFT_479964 [Podospora appendiculata]|uniref:F-box domain-containing protein n=1 Tax=Podospora appendiculata TaxID=314037 RepID=A0AAE0XAH8_9PEZI|nr:hypothetical protein B0T22DRAFT_479964 [Podospora appendiculata]
MSSPRVSTVTGRVLTLATMPSEIQLEILAQLEPSVGGAALLSPRNPQTIKAERHAIAMLCLVSKQFYQLATPQLYRYMTLSNFEQMLLLIRTLCTRGDLARRIRYLYFPASFQKPADAIVGPGMGATGGNVARGHADYPNAMACYVLKHYAHPASTHVCCLDWLAARIRAVQADEAPQPAVNAETLIPNYLRQTLLVMLFSIRLPNLRHLHIYFPPGQNDNRPPKILMDTLSRFTVPETGITITRGDPQRSRVIAATVFPPVTELTLDVGCALTTITPHNGIHHEAWQELMSIPSITKINLLGDGAAWVYRPSRTALAGSDRMLRGPWLANLRVMKYCLSDNTRSNVLRDLFRLTPNLEDLHLYRPCTLPHQPWYFHFASPATYIHLFAALGSLCSSLKRLRLELLLAGWRTSRNIYQQDFAFLGSFQPWKRLEHLTVTLQALVGDCICPEMISLVNFGNLFPASLKRLEIIAWLPRRSRVSWLYASSVSIDPLTSAFAKLSLEDAAEPTAHDSTRAMYARLGNATTDAQISGRSSALFLDPYTEGIQLFFRRLVRDVAMKPGMELREIEYHLVEECPLDKATMREIRNEFARCGVRFRLQRYKLWVKRTHGLK